MLNILLNIIGIILVLYSIIIIKKDNQVKLTDNKIFKEDIDKNNYYEFNNETSEDFDLLMDSKVQSKLENDQLQINNTVTPIIKSQMINSLDDNMNPLHKKIMELKSIGLDNSEIAKKMGKGVREIDIILNIYMKDI